MFIIKKSSDVKDLSDLQEIEFEFIEQSFIQESHKENSSTPVNA